ncbi:anti-sigma factor [Frankia sp. CIT1]|uniref:anti-sigma factor n=1 Tax=Frankia sp. CIT1 TaxID=2880974 RepID=UPI001EF58301|nr:anti-sigma factor [Frankia sp. CIT1]
MTPPRPSSPDIHALTGAYVLDAVDGDERAMVDEHLASCDVCAREVTELRLTATALTRADEVEPPASLRAAVLARIATAPQLPAPQLPAPDDRPRDGQRRGQPRHPRLSRRVTAAAAAALVTVTGLGLTVAGQQRRLDSERQRADRLSALAAAALSRSAAMPLAGGGSLAVVAVAGNALVSARDLPVLTGGRVYQFWLAGPSPAGPDGVRSAGIADGRAVAVDRLLTGVGDARSIVVTAEPAGGSARPTTPMLIDAPIRA